MKKYTIAALLLATSVSLTLALIKAGVAGEDADVGGGPTPRQVISATLSQGSADRANVRALQTYLVSMNCMDNSLISGANASSHGVYGNGTANAVRAFQTANGLSVDGSVQRSTMVTINNGSASSCSQVVVNNNVTGTTAAVLQSSSNPVVNNASTIVTGSGSSQGGAAPSTICNVVPNCTVNGVPGVTASSCSQPLVTFPGNSCFTANGVLQTPDGLIFHFTPVTDEARRRTMPGSVVPNFQVSIPVLQTSSCNGNGLVLAKVLKTDGIGYDRNLVKHAPYFEDDDCFFLGGSNPAAGPYIVKNNGDLYFFGKNAAGQDTTIQQKFSADAKGNTFPYKGSPLPRPTIFNGRDVIDNQQTGCSIDGVSGIPFSHVTNSSFPTYDAGIAKYTFSPTACYVSTGGPKVLTQEGLLFYFDASGPVLQNCDFNRASSAHRSEFVGSFTAYQIKNARASGFAVDNSQSFINNTVGGLSDKACFIQGAQGYNMYAVDLNGDLYAPGNGSPVKQIDNGKQLKGFHGNWQLSTQVTAGASTGKQEAPYKCSFSPCPAPGPDVKATPTSVPNTTCFNDEIGRFGCSIKGEPITSECSINTTDKGIWLKNSDLRNSGFAANSCVSVGGGIKKIRTPDGLVYNMATDGTPYLASNNCGKDGGLDKLHSFSVGEVKNDPASPQSLKSALTSFNNSSCYFPPVASTGLGVLSGPWLAASGYVVDPNGNYYSFKADESVPERVPNTKGYHSSFDQDEYAAPPAKNPYITVYQFDQNGVKSVVDSTHPLIVTNGVAKISVKTEPPTGCFAYMFAPFGSGSVDANGYVYGTENSGRFVGNNQAFSVLSSQNTIHCGDASVTFRTDDKTVYVAPLPQLPAPTNVRLSGSPTNTGFNVTWNSVAGAVRYEIYVNGSYVGYDMDATTPYNVGNRTAGTTYSITVIATGDPSTHQASSASTPLSVTTTGTAPAGSTGGADSQKPSKPSNLSVDKSTTVNSVCNSLCVTLSWNNSTDNVGVTSYKFFKDGVLNSTIVASSGNTRDFPQLSAGTTYTLGVSALDAAGNESDRASIAFTLSQSGVVTLVSSGANQSPNAPVVSLQNRYNVSAPSITGNNSKFSILAKSNDETNLTHYRLRIDGDSDSMYVMQADYTPEWYDISLSDISSILSIDLKKQSHTFEFSACNGTYCGDWTSVAVNIVCPATTPTWNTDTKMCASSGATAGPTGLSVSNVTNNQVTFGFDTVSYPVEVYVYSNSSKYNSYHGYPANYVSSGSVGRVSKIVENLMPGTLYEFKFYKVIGGVKSTVFTSISTTTKGTLAAPGIPNVRLQKTKTDTDAPSITSNSDRFYLSFLKSGGSYYETTIKVRVDNGAESVIDRNPDELNDFNLNALGTNVENFKSMDLSTTTHVFEFAACNLTLCSSWASTTINIVCQTGKVWSRGNRICITAGTATAPGAPTSLTKGIVTSTTTVLSWTAPTGTVTEYNVYRGATIIGSTNSTTRTYTAIGLTPSTAYTFTVKAVNGTTESLTASNQVTVTTSAAQAAGQSLGGGGTAGGSASALPAKPVLLLDDGVSVRRTVDATTTLNFKWDTPNTTSYTFKIDAPGYNKDKEYTFTATSSTFKMSDLGIASGVVTLTVKACNVSNRCSAYSSPVTVTVLAEVAPTIPVLTLAGSSNDRKSVSSNESVIFSWFTPGATSYKFKIDAPGYNKDKEYTFTTTSATFKMSDLGIRSGVVKLMVKACNSVCSRYSNTITVTVSASAFNGAESSPLVLQEMSGSVLGVSTSCVDLPRNIHRGAEGIYVKKLQSFLAEKGFLDDVITGFYGDKTVTAVKDYQVSRKLPETGMVYDFTRDAIRNETCN